MTRLVLCDGSFERYQCITPLWRVAQLEQARADNIPSLREQQARIAQYQEEGNNHDNQP